LWLYTNVYYIFIKILKALFNYDSIYFLFFAFQSYKYVSNDLLTVELICIAFGTYNTCESIAHKQFKLNFAD